MRRHWTNDIFLTVYLWVSKMHLLFQADCHRCHRALPLWGLSDPTDSGASSSSPRKLPAPHPGELRPWESAPHPIPGKRARSPWSSVQREGEGEWGRGGEGSLWGAGARCCSRNSGAGKAAINQTRNDQSLRWVCNWGEKESADLGKERKMWVELARGESRMKHHASPCITAKLQQMRGKSQKWEENEKPEPWLRCVCDGWIRQVVKDGEEQPPQGCEA